jgi:hypothetical protein
VLRDQARARLGQPVVYERREVLGDVVGMVAVLDTREGGENPVRLPARVQLERQGWAS